MGVQVAKLGPHALGLLLHLGTLGQQAVTGLLQVGALVRQVHDRAHLALAAVLGGHLVLAAAANVADKVQLMGKKKTGFLLLLFITCFCFN